MHGEAFIYTRQTLGYPRAALSAARRRSRRRRRPALPGDVEVPGGTFLLGASPDEPSSSTTRSGRTPSSRAVRHRPRAGDPGASSPRSSRTAATAAASCGATTGWRWREQAGARRTRSTGDATGGDWRAARLRPLGAARAAPARAPRQLVRGRGLLPLGGPPPADRGRVGGGRRGEPTADGACRREAPLPLGRRAARRRARANLDGDALGCLSTSARLADGRQRLRLPADDRQRLGVDRRPTSCPTPASSPIRTGSTRSPGSARTRCCAAAAGRRAPRLLRNTWRNFYTPDRRDVWAGFRTCAL